MKNLMLLFVTILFIVGCQSVEQSLKSLNDEEEIAKDYLESLGYKVISYVGHETVMFTHENLRNLPYKQFWAVQSAQPDNFLNKELLFYHFLVENHPLANLFESKKVLITVAYFEDALVGGTSFPYSKGPLVGGSYSIDGLTAEEIQIDYMTWSKAWDEKYGVK